MTANDAIENAARLLQQAELTTDLALMDRLDSLARVWVTIAEVVLQREQA